MTLGNVVLDIVLRSWLNWILKTGKAKYRSKRYRRNRLRTRLGDYIQQLLEKLKNGDPEKRPGRIRKGMFRVEFIRLKRIDSRRGILYAEANIPCIS